MTNHYKAPPQLQPVPNRSGVFTPRSYAWSGALTLVTLVAIWQLASLLNWIDPVFAPSPLEIMQALVAMINTGEIWLHSQASFLRFSLGFALGAIGGIGFGLAIGLFTLLRSPGATLVAALFPIPKIALLPLFILWFGIGEASKIATIAFGTFFPIVIATYGAVDQVDRSLVRMARSFDISTLHIVLKVIFPGALPGIFSGLRIATSIGIVLLVAAEMIGATEGIGALVLASGNLMQIDRLLAGVVILSLFGLSLSSLINLLEGRLLRWR